MNEDDILEWVLELHESQPDVIETVDRKTLQVLINDVDHLAVFFCKFNEIFLINTKTNDKFRLQITINVKRALLF